MPTGPFLASLEKVTKENHELSDKIDQLQMHTENL